MVYMPRAEVTRHPWASLWAKLAPLATPLPHPSHPHPHPHHPHTPSLAQHRRRQLRNEVDRLRHPGRRLASRLAYGIADIGFAKRPPACEACAISRIAWALLARHDAPSLACLHTCKHTQATGIHKTRG